MEKEEWGPWIDHDMSGCPIPDGYVFEAFVRFHDEEGLSEPVMMGIDVTRSEWNDVDQSARIILSIEGKVYGIIQYRIRKPRGMVILESLLQDLPQKVDA